MTAGSLMGHTKLRLSTWFPAVDLISQAKTGLSALALKRQLGVSYPTAWLLHQKTYRAMAQREDTNRLRGAVQLNDAFLGGERSGGKSAGGSENKVPFVAAVLLNDQVHPLYVKLNMVSGFTSKAIGQWAEGSLESGTCVRSDGQGCIAADADADCVHRPMILGDLLPRVTSS